MGIRRRLFFAVCSVCTLFLGGTVAAQSGGSIPPHPLIDMLSMVPAEVGSAPPPEYAMVPVQWADIRANEQARPGVPTPANTAALFALPENELALWTANFQRLIGIAPDMQNIRGFDADMINYLGFDLLEIDRTLSFGRPPGTGVIYAGHFDPQRITNTLVARTYTTTTLNGLPALCGPVGCEHGSDPQQWLPDQQGVDPVTLKKPGVFMILGSRLGRQEPIVLAPGAILNSASWDILTGMVATTQGEQPSVYDLPDYRAIADFAADGSELLIQVLYLYPQGFSAADYSDVVAGYLAISGSDLPEPDREKLAQRLGINPEAWADLPVYSLAALVDRQDGPDQVHYWVLVYDNEADAQQAADVVTRRFPEVSALIEWQVDAPLLDFLDSYTLEPGRVVSSPDTGRWLAVATLRVPLPSNDPDPDLQTIRSSGKALALCYRAMLVGYFTPLVVVLPE